MATAVQEATRLAATHGTAAADTPAHLGTAGLYLRGQTLYEAVAATPELAPLGNCGGPRCAPGRRHNRALTHVGAAGPRLGICALLSGSVGDGGGGAGACASRAACVWVRLQYPAGGAGRAAVAGQRVLFAFWRPGGASGRGGVTDRAPPLSRRRWW